MNNLATTVLRDSTTTPSASVTNTIVGERETLNGHYCSYRAYQGMIWKALEEADVSTDFLNERLYFRALEKIKVVVRGKLSTTDGTVKVIRTKTGGHLPPQEFVQKVTDEGSYDVYAIKRGSYGFNCEDQFALAEKVLVPVVNLFTNMVEEVEKKLSQIENNADSLKAMGMTVSDAKALTSKSIINKYL